MPDEAGEMGCAARMADEDSREWKRSQAAARSSGVQSSAKKRIEIARTDIHGSGTGRAKRMCATEEVADDRGGKE